MSAKPSVGPLEAVDSPDGQHEARAGKVDAGLATFDQKPPGANLIESTRQQQDREFFKRFLAPQVGDSGSEGAILIMDELGGRSQDVVGSSGQFRQPNGSGSRADASASLDEQQLAQAMGLAANLHWTPSGYTLPLMYSAFGASGNYPTTSNRNASTSTAAAQGFYNEAALSGGSNSDRVFQGQSDGVGGLLDSYNNLFSSEANFKAALAKRTNPYQRNQGDLAGSAAAATTTGRTFASALHNQAASSLFDVRPQLAGGNGDLLGARSDHRPSGLMAGAHQGQLLLMNSGGGGQARLLNEFLALTGGGGPYSQQMMGPSGGQQNFSRQSSASHLTQGRNMGPSFLQHHRHQATDRTSAFGGSNGPRRRNNYNSNNKLPGPFVSDAQAAYAKLSAYTTAASTSSSPSSLQPLAPTAANSSHNASGAGGERFSRKVFVGGLPPDIDEEEIKASFRRFGALVVDWPHKAESKSYFPPKGYAFLLFQEELSVQALIGSCFQEEDKLYLCVSSPTIKDKPVQIRPWRLSDTDYVLDATLALDPRKTVFVGGVPRPLKASELANVMNNLYGGVCYAGIDTDPELKYPKGAGRVAFSSHQSYIAAISARFVHIHHSEIEKRVEVKPYVLDDQFCDECQGARCANKFAPFFCANINCLRYYCDHCWSSVHSQAGREAHKPLVKEGGDRPRAAQSFRW